jgi:very-short-patch-repair endonuclease
MCMISPYKNIEVENWRAVTESLVRQHPLSPYIVDFCLNPGRVFCMVR